ncbi:MAG: hypothetical protein LAN64_17905 [Acidobacteriia bacterium]|nr:hypothetical protein [Terriglobia bacterium]
MPPAVVTGAEVPAGALALFLTVLAPAVVELAVLPLEPLEASAAGNRDQQHARLLGFLLYLHAEPARFVRREQVHRHAVLGIGAQQNAVVPARTQCDVLHLLPQGRAAGLILK